MVLVNGRADPAASGTCTPCGSVPLPPSMCHGVRFADVVHRPRPFQPARGSSMRPSICFTKKPIGYGTRATTHLPFCRTSSAVGEVAGRDRNVLAGAERVVLVHPVVVVGVGGAPIRRVALEVRARHRVERPALRAVLAGGVRAVQRSLALAPIEAGVVAAGQHGPEDAVGVDVHAARVVARAARHLSGTAPRRSPRASSIGGFDPGATRTAAPGNALALPQTDPSTGLTRCRRSSCRSACPWSDRPAASGLHPRVLLAVAVGVENERRPTLRLLLVAGLVEHLRIDPADDAAFARPDGVVRVVREVQVERAEAGIDDA